MESASLLTSYGPLGIFSLLMVVAIVVIVREFRNHMREAINDCKTDRAALIATLHEKEQQTQAIVVEQARTQVQTNSVMTRVADAMDRSSAILEHYRADEETQRIERGHGSKSKRGRSGEFEPHDRNIA